MWESNEYLAACVDTQIHYMQISCLTHVAQSVMCNTSNNCAHTHLCVCACLSGITERVFEIIVPYLKSLVYLLSPHLVCVCVSIHCMCFCVCVCVCMCKCTSYVYVCLCMCMYGKSPETPFLPWLPNIPQSRIKEAAKPVDSVLSAPTRVQRSN